LGAALDSSAAESALERLRFAAYCHCLRPPAALDKRSIWLCRSNVYLPRSLASCVKTVPPLMIT